MDRYRRKPQVVKAFEWFKNGDHPEDYCKSVRPDDSKCTELTPGKIVRPFQDPTVPGGISCTKCGKRMSSHGQITSLKSDGIVCPADWITTNEDNGEIRIERPSEFKKTYKQIVEKVK